MKKNELVELANDAPDVHACALAMECRYRRGKHFRGEDPSKVQGLGTRYTWSHHAMQIGRLALA